MNGALGSDAFCTEAGGYGNKSARTGARRGAFVGAPKLDERPVDPEPLLERYGLITEEHLAALIGIGVQSLRNRHRSQLPKSVKVGRRRFFKEASVREMLGIEEAPLVPQRRTKTMTVSYYAPRGMSREEAARYIGVHAAAFDVLVQQGACRSQRRSVFTMSGTGISWMQRFPFSMGEDDAGGALSYRSRPCWDGLDVPWCARSPDTALRRSAPDVGHG